MIFKRKSFHLFRNIGNKHITEEELKDIEKEFSKLKPLVDDIKIKIKIEKKKSILRGQEYCILFYSEKKDNYLQNIGYIGEQLDLYLVSKNIGTLWFGIGKPDEQQLDAKNLNGNMDVKNLTEEQAKNLAYEIVSDPNNVDQVKVFPDL